ncbi:MAG TPA: hypothetical protein VGZ32_10855 [Actinocrinis sp.]|jgi:hypothetical protein|uniref:hypothetical protein n=1 Tax=Actinocrinis sp. TaxID=1920516 RepID=UPI002DDDADE7|nr:hypothetical protein [Actinocrinis sp.]HEV3170832.1 hypothetical protein [Actinocrinis sp.]
MTDNSTSFNNTVKDDHLNAAFNFGGAERGGRRRARVTPDPDAAVLPLPVAPSPRRGIQRGESSRDDTPCGTR